jgi:WD40 repeat protein
VFDIDSGEILPLPLPPMQLEAPRAFALAADGRHLLWARAGGALEWRDLRSDAPPVVLAGHTAKVAALAVSADGRLAFSCGDDRTLRAWDLARGCALAAFTADAPWRALALAPDGCTVAAGDAAGTVHWFRLAGR